MDLCTDPRHAHRFKTQIAANETRATIRTSRETRIAPEDDGTWVVYIYTPGKPDVYIKEP